MRPGIGIIPTTVGHPDFPGDTGMEPGCTVSYDGPGVLVNVTKCETCGHSFAGTPSTTTATPETDAFISSVDGQWDVRFKKLSDKARDLERRLTAALAELERVRSELEVSQKEVAKKQGMIEAHCVDWAEDDTAIKAVCAKFGIREDDNPGYFKSAVECVDELAVLLDASKRREGVLRDALKSAESALANSYDVTDWPATPDCQSQLALNEVRSALGAGSEEGK